MRIRLSRKSEALQEKERLEKEWAIAIRARDNNACVVCHTFNRPNAHHILPRELHKWKFDKTNGITLCVKHHKFSRTLSAHNCSLPFFVWLSCNRPEQFRIAWERAKVLMESEVKWDEQWRENGWNN